MPARTRLYPPIPTAHESRTITVVRFTAMPRPMPAGMMDPMPEAWVTLEGVSGEWFLLSWYPDELQFTPSDFTGITVADARARRTAADLRYLRS